MVNLFSADFTGLSGRPDSKKTQGEAHLNSRHVEIGATRFLLLLFGRNYSGYFCFLRQEGATIKGVAEVFKDRQAVLAES